MVNKNISKLDILAANNQLVFFIGVLRNEKKIYYEVQNSNYNPNGLLSRFENSVSFDKCLVSNWNLILFSYHMLFHASLSFNVAVFLFCWTLIRKIIIRIIAVDFFVVNLAEFVFIEKYYLWVRLVQILEICHFHFLYETFDWQINLLSINS